MLRLGQFQVSRLAILGHLGFFYFFLRRELIQPGDSSRHLRIRPLESLLTRAGLPELGKSHPALQGNYTRVNLCFPLDYNVLDQVVAGGALVVVEDGHIVVSRWFISYIS